MNGHLEIEGIDCSDAVIGRCLDPITPLVKFQFLSSHIVFLNLEGISSKSLQISDREEEEEWRGFKGESVLILKSLSWECDFRQDFDLEE